MNYSHTTARPSWKRQSSERTRFIFNGFIIISDRWQWLDVTFSNMYVMNVGPMCPIFLLPPLVPMLLLLLIVFLFPTKSTLHLFLFIFNWGPSDFHWGCLQKHEEENSHRSTGNLLVEENVSPSLRNHYLPIDPWGKWSLRSLAPPATIQIASCYIKCIINKAYEHNTVPTYIQCPQRPEGGIRSPGTGDTVISCHVGAKN